MYHHASRDRYEIKPVCRGAIEQEYAHEQRNKNGDAASQQQGQPGPLFERIKQTYGNSFLQLNRIEEARATVEEAQARNSDSPPLHFLQYQLAFLQTMGQG